MKALLHITYFSLVVASCSPNVDSSSSMGKRGSSDVFDLSRPPTDAAALLVTDLQMSHMQVKGANVGSLYLAASGLSDFVEVSACYSKGCDATRKEVTNRIVFAPFPNEPITIKARACVEPERASVAGVLCGAWKEIVWSQPPNGNAALAELLSLREKYRADLEDMGERVKDALVRFEKDVAVCNQRAIAAENVFRIRNIVGNFVSVGEQLISKALSPGNMNKDGQSTPAGTPTGEGIVPSVNVNGAMKKAAENAAAVDPKAVPGASAALGNTQKAAAQAAGGAVQYDLATITDPVGGLRGLANAVIDIATATEQVDAMRPCFAQSRAESVSSVIKTRIEEIRGKLAEVESQITAQGGL